MAKKVVLAYSGGLDTSCCLQWLKDKGFDVICFSANLGSEFSPANLRRRALKSGAKKIYIKDLRKEFAYSYILPALKAGAVYEGKYVLSTALGRPLIAKYLVEVAKKEKCTFVAHGCSAKGNDQVRLDTTVKMLKKGLNIIAPLREWELTTRGAELAYARKKKLPVRASQEKLYSIDQNIWGVSIEAGALEDIKNEPDEGAYVLTQSPKKAPAKPQYVTIEFQKGMPVAINGSKYDLLSVIRRVNRIGAKHAVGRTDMIENRLVGIKSREVYEAPGAWILLTAHKELEALVLDKSTLQFKEIVSREYARLAYQGLWFSHLKKALDAFVLLTQQRVTGAITLKLYKGTLRIAKRESKYSLYQKNLATYGKEDSFDRSSAKGFIEIFSLPYRR